MTAGFSALPSIAQEIRDRLASIEESICKVAGDVHAIEHQWVRYGEAAPLGIRRQDIGGNPMRFRGQLEAIVVDRLRYLVRDFERSFRETKVSTVTPLSDLGGQVQRLIVDTLAAHLAEQQARECG